MKRVIPLMICLCPIVGICEELPDIKIQMLDSEIEKLIHERDEKYAKLQECAKNVKGFKIAGITTLAATGIGVYANIRLAQALNENKNGGSGGKSARVVDNRPQKEKNDESCKLLCSLGAAPATCSC